MYPESRVGRLAGAASVQTERETPFHLLSRCHDELTQLCDRVEVLSAKLVGETPLNDKKVAGRPQMPGLLGAVEASAQDSLDRIRAMHAALNRVQEHLP